MFKQASKLPDGVHITGFASPSVVVGFNLSSVFKASALLLWVCPEHVPLRGWSESWPMINCWLSKAVPCCAVLLWASCRQVQVSSERKTGRGSYTKLGNSFGDPVLLTPCSLSNSQRPLFSVRWTCPQYPWMKRQSFCHRVSYSCSQTLPT